MRKKINNVVKSNVELLTSPFMTFFRHEASSGIILLLFAILALVLANTSLSTFYNEVLNTQMPLGPAKWHLDLTILYWINDGLMAIFFFVIGLEIKREFLFGELKSLSATILPISAAIGGILVATILNHFVAIAAGIYLHSFIPKDIVELVASIAFIIFGLWILKDDELGNEAEKNRFSIFWTVAIAFFLAEMGDKTQLATVALSAQIGADMLSILVGTTLGMLVADGLGILLGATLHKYVPDRVIKKFASLIFILFGVVGILHAMNIIFIGYNIYKDYLII